ncbi:hypothetical protein QT971_30085, partial [Microcoleus sp. herbarium19]|uniref:hypothetical protein n=1 Tax=Microcoleus sp. herbarium19 TaxID=3055440 RepID=UPI002FD06ED6
MQKDDGSGNFNKYHDGLGNPRANGYMYADTLIDLVNTSTAYFYNPPLWYYHENMPIPENPSVRIKLILKGVYYHRNSSFNNYQTTYANTGSGFSPSVSSSMYAVRNDKEINLFVTNPKI